MDVDPPVETTIDVRMNDSKNWDNFSRKTKIFNEKKIKFVKKRFFRCSWRWSFIGDPQNNQRIHLDDVTDNERTKERTNEPSNNYD